MKTVISVPAVIQHMNICTTCVELMTGSRSMKLNSGFVNSEQIKDQNGVMIASARRFTTSFAD